VYWKDDGSSESTRRGKGGICTGTVNQNNCLTSKNVRKARCSPYLLLSIIPAVPRAPCYVYMPDVCQKWEAKYM